MRFRVIAAVALILVQASPLHATTLFALLSTGELYRSVNGGVTWNAFASIPVDDAVGLAAGVSVSDLYLLSRSGGLYHSANGGVSWTAVGAIPAPDAEALALRPDGGILVLTRSGTLYLSRDQGSSFTALAGLTGSNWASLAPGSPGRYCALSETGEMEESRDGGATWAAIGVVTTSNAVGLRHKGTDLYVLMGSGEVARSDDDGQTWVTVGAMAASGMLAPVDDGTQLIAANETGEVAVSADGTSWAWVGAINQLSVTALGTDTPVMTGVAVGPSAPSFELRVPYPNPRLGAGGVTYSFSSSGFDGVRLELFTADGRMAASRGWEWFAGSGRHEIHWEPANLPAGSYIVRVTTASGKSASTKWTSVR